MRTIFLKIIAFIVFISFLTTGCNKYPEGPTITLRSKEERLANNWKIDKYYENDVEKTSDFNTIFPDYLLSIVKSGTYSISYTSSGNSFLETGTWRLANNAKEWETLSNVSGAIPISYTILRLKEKSFWCSRVDLSGVILKYHFKPQ